MHRRRRHEEPRSQNPLLRPGGGGASPVPVFPFAHRTPYDRNQITRLRQWHRSAREEVVIPRKSGRTYLLSALSEEPSVQGNSPFRPAPTPGRLPSTSASKRAHTSTLGGATLRNCRRNARSRSNPHGACGPRSCTRPSGGQLWDTFTAPSTRKILQPQAAQKPPLWSNPSGKAFSWPAKSRIRGCCRPRPNC